MQVGARKWVRCTCCRWRNYVGLAPIKWWHRFYTLDHYFIVSSAWNALRFTRMSEKKNAKSSKFNISNSWLETEKFLGKYVCRDRFINVLRTKFAVSRKVFVFRMEQVFVEGYEITTEETETQLEQSTQCGLSFPYTSRVATQSRTALISSFGSRQRILTTKM